MQKFKILTPEQESYLAQIRTEYSDAALKGHRIDRNKLNKTISSAYTIMGKQVPLIIFTQSPIQAMLCLFILHNQSNINLGNTLVYKFKNELEDDLGTCLDDAIYDVLCEELKENIWTELSQELEIKLKIQLGNKLENIFKKEIWSEFTDQLSSESKIRTNNLIRSQLNSNLRVHLEEEFETWLRVELEQHLKNELGPMFWNMFYNKFSNKLLMNIKNKFDAKLYNPYYLKGSQNLYLIAYYKFCEMIGVPYSKNESCKLKIIEQINSQCEWWWPYENICVVSEKPIKVCWNNQNELHNESGPAVKYEDGCSLYVWNGVNVPGCWIKDKENLDFDEIIKTENIEQQIAGIDIYNSFNKN